MPNDVQATPVDEDAPVSQPLIEETKKERKKIRRHSTVKPSAFAERFVQSGMRKYLGILEIARKKDVNESDTSNIVNDILGDVLGYDKFFDVTTEYKIRGQYADYGIRINDKILAFIEVKAIGIALNQNHLFQVASYAVHEGVDWVILTNGHVWQLYRIQETKPVETLLVTSIDLLSSEIKNSEKVKVLSSFHKRNFLSGHLESLWREKSCVNPSVLKSIIKSKRCLDFLKRELRRMSGYSVEPHRIEEMLINEIIK